MLKTKVEINLEVGREYTKKERGKMNNLEMQNEEKKRQERMEKLGFQYDEKNKLILDHNQFVETFTSENKVKLYDKGYAIYEENYWKKLKQRDVGALIREEINPRSILRVFTFISSNEFSDEYPLPKSSISTSKPIPRISSITM